MWSLLPAVPAQKRTRQQTASPTWDPRFPPGGWFTYLEHSQNQKRKCSTCSSRRLQGNTWDVNKPLCAHSAGHTPQKMRHLYNSELLDIYCSQCCKKVNLLNDLEARLRNLKANRYRAAAACRHESVCGYKLFQWSVKKKKKRPQGFNHEQVWKNGVSVQPLVSKVSQTWNAFYTKGNPPMRVKDFGL